MAEEGDMPCVWCGDPSIDTDVRIDRVDGDDELHCLGCGVTITAYQLAEDGWHAKQDEDGEWRIQPDDVDVGVEPPGLFDSSVYAGECECSCCVA